MKDIVSFINEFFVWVSLAVAVIYSPFAKSWFKSIGIVLIISLLSFCIGIYDIMFAADGKKNLLACLVFPIFLLIIAIVFRLLRLTILPLHKKEVISTK
jgi:hypothetical protein